MRRRRHFPTRRSCACCTKKGIIPILTGVNKGGTTMIVFDRLWSTMEKKGVSTYQLRERCGIDSKTVRRLRANENIETKTLDKLCAVLECGLEDIAEYRPDKL